jgi:hypothetical protein
MPVCKTLLAMTEIIGNVARSRRGIVLTCKPKFLSPFFFKRYGSVSNSKK